MGSLTCGIVGLPNVGKSTLFNALTSAGVPAANYPFCTIDPHMGVAQVPDTRLDELTTLVTPESCLPAVVQFVDIAGLVRGASQGEGLGNQFLGHILGVQVIVHVVRCFQDPSIIHVSDQVNPLADKEIIDTELQIKDLERLEKHKQRLANSHKSTPQLVKPQIEWLSTLETHLKQGHSTRTFDLESAPPETLTNLPLLSAKPVIYLANVAEEDLPNGNAHAQKLMELAHSEKAECLVASAAFEHQLSQLAPNEQAEYLSLYAMEQSALTALIRLVYKHLGLITYFTAGKKEVRAWTIRQGTVARQAAGVIHSDFEKNFIRAETIAHQDFLELGNVAACRKAGKLAVQGSDYVVQDGDILHFLTS